MNKTVSSVIDDINEWENPHGGSVFYVTAICTDEDVLSVGRKDMDAALEVKGLLQETIGVEQDFVLEPAKPTKTGRTKWKVLGFGTPGGAVTYTAPQISGAFPGVQGGGNTSAGVSLSSGRAGRSPEHDHYIQERMDRRTALMQAVQARGSDAARGISFKWQPDAETMYAWLRKTSDAPSAYPGGDLSGPPSTPPADASEDLPQESRPQPADSAGSVEAGEGEALASTPHEVAVLPGGSYTHIHDYQLRQGVKGFLVCECGKTTKKATG